MIRYFERTARVEILDRLLEENHRRAAAEAQAASARPKFTGRRTRGTPDGEATLFS